MSERPYVVRVGTAVSRTRDATEITLRRRDARVVFGSVTVSYLVVYLWAIGHLAPGFGGYGVDVVASPLVKFLRPELGPLSFTPVARVTLGPVTYLFSFNTVVGFCLAALVGLNLALTYLASTQPETCGIEASSASVIASLPALLSGTACCGPVVLLALGIQASGVLMTTFQFLLPVAALVLVASLVLVGRQVEPRTS